MIRLLEHEGKALLARHGFAVPEGALYPAPPPGPGPWMVKAQVLAGGRGKAGGIREVHSTDEVAAVAAAMNGLTIGGQAVQAVYVEHKLNIAHEFYLAAQVDRDRGQPVLLACRDGGVDIESVPRDRIVACPVDPLVGLGDHAVGRIARALAFDGLAAEVIAEAALRIYAILVAEDAELVEINPLVVDANGRLLAADAKVILDEDAAFRHPGRKAIPDGTPFEEEARRLQVMGVELDGDIAAMMNGAGMTMATLDQLVAMGGQVRALVELHGVMGQGPDHIARVLALMLSLEPKVLLINMYFQFRTLDTIADGVVKAVEAVSSGSLPPIVLRLRGNMEDDARRILEGVPCFITGNFKEACAKAIALSGRPVRPV